MDVVRYLRGVFEVVKEVILGVKWLNACSIIVFGSAARPEDFVKGVSDVDVLVLTKDEPSRRHYSFMVENSEVNVVFYTVDEFRELVECGNPLAFILKYRVVLHDDCSKFLLKLKPKVTEHTKYVLRKSIFTALGLSLESYYVLDDYKKALSHLIHSLRHLIRYKASFKGEFPVSDEELSKYCTGTLKNLYFRLSNLRRGKFAGNDLKRLIDETIRVITERLNLKATYLKDLESKAKGNMILISAGESNGYLAFRIEMLEDNRRRVIEIRGKEIREVSSIFF